MRCELRQEAGNIMMVPVISVACRQFKMKNTLFSCALACHAVQMCSLRLQFADLFDDLPMAHKITVNQTGAFCFYQACSEDDFNFFQKQTVPIVLFQSLWMFFLWLVFTSNLISQTTWLRSNLNLLTCNLSLSQARKTVFGLPLRSLCLCFLELILVPPEAWQA